MGSPESSNKFKSYLSRLDAPQLKMGQVDSPSLNIRTVAMSHRTTLVIGEPPFPQAKKTGRKLLSHKVK